MSFRKGDDLAGGGVDATRQHEPGRGLRLGAHERVAGATFHADSQREGRGEPRHARLIDLLRVLLRSSRRRYATQVDPLPMADGYRLFGTMTPPKGRSDATSNELSPALYNRFATARRCKIASPLT